MPGGGARQGAGRRRRVTVALAAMAVPGFLFLYGAATTIGNVWRAGIRDVAVLGPHGQVDHRCANSEIPVLPGNQSGCVPNYSSVTRVLPLVLVAVGLAIFAWICWIVAARMLRPLSAAADTVRQLGPQNLGQRIRMTGAADKLKELADAFDGALDRLAAGYESQRRFAANASHELRTPLAVQRLLTELAVQRLLTEVAMEAAGLGLSIVRSVTNAHGGTIRARPRPDGGLIVEFELPESQ